MRTCRAARAALVVAIAFAALAIAPRTSHAQTGAAQDLVRARELDQQGVHAYRDGHYRDAIKLFEEAHRLGGPSSEIWNIARCYQKLDEPEQAEALFARYLAQNDLSAEDRAAATKELDELAKQPSMLSVDSDPPGAAVLVDGKRPARETDVTPMALEVAPGRHTVRVETTGVRPFETTVDARYGRAILVRADLRRGRGAGGAGATPPAASRANESNEPNDTSGGTGAGAAGRGQAEGGEPDRDVGAASHRGGAANVRRVSVAIEIGYFVPELGAQSQGLRPAGDLAVRYAFVARPGWLATLGVRVVATRYGGSPPDAAPLCQLSNDYGAYDLGALAVLGAAKRLGRVRLGGDLGVGIAGLVAASDGGDARSGNCGGYGVKGLAHAGTEVSYALGARVRVLLSPVTFEAHPGYDGARTTPVDATGVWWRVGSALGAAFDL